MLPLKYKSPGQSAADFPNPSTFLRLDPCTGSVLALCGTVLVAGGYREAEVHLQPKEEPALEQRHARRRLWRHREPVLEQGPGKTCGEREEPALELPIPDPMEGTQAELFGA